MTVSDRFIRDLVEYATKDFDQGRLVETPVYKAVVENRQEEAKSSGTFYSSCGDLAHWLLYRLGLRTDTVNRKEHKGWEWFGARNNVTRLATDPAARPYKGEQLHTGDILIVATADPLGKLGLGPTHVTVVLDADQAKGKITTGDYGQPGGRMYTRPYFKASDGKWWRNQKPIDIYLPIREVLKGATAAPESAHDWAVRLRLPDPPAQTPSGTGGLVGALLVGSAAGFAADQFIKSRRSR